MFKKLALATALLAGLSTAHAYQFEINGGYENTDLEESSDLDTFFINGKYYLNGVQVKNAPLAEAAFLAKASNIGLGYVNSNLDVTDKLSNPVCYRVCRTDQQTLGRLIFSWLLLWSQK